VPSAAASLRTFQRRAKRWRELHGPPQELIFRQVHKPGEYAEFDWTHVREDNYTVTIAGQPFKHLLTPLRAALLQLGMGDAVPVGVRAVAAAWRAGGAVAIGRGVAVAADRLQLERHPPDRARPQEKARVQRKLSCFCKHPAHKPRTIHVHSPNENADVEASHAHLKRRIKNHLILRGSCDFATEADYAAFVAKICERTNALRVGKLAEELHLFGSCPPVATPRPMSSRPSSPRKVRSV